MTNKVYNFSAGPSVLPEQVLVDHLGDFEKKVLG